MGVGTTQEKKKHTNTPAPCPTQAEKPFLLEKESRCGHNTKKCVGNRRKGRLALLCLFYRADLQTHPAPYTNLLIDLRVLKSFLVFFHSYRPFGAYCVACRATTAIFFSGEKNWYIFHRVFSFFIIFSIPLFHSSNHPVVWVESRNENGLDGFRV